MHKWFIESQTLASMLLELYEKHESDLKNTGTDSMFDYQLKICHAMQYVFLHIIIIHKINGKNI